MQRHLSISVVGKHLFPSGVKKFPSLRIWPETTKSEKTWFEGPKNPLDSNAQKFLEPHFDSHQSPYGPMDKARSRRFRVWVPVWAFFGEEPSEIVMLCSRVVQLVRICGFHPQDPGSNPGVGNFCESVFFHCCACRSRLPRVVRLSISRSALFQLSNPERGNKGIWNSLLAELFPGDENR